MKKLLSICFLSILLGLLSFSTQAQSSCRSGFWIENLQPETLSGVANVPGGDLVLDNVLNRSVVGATDLYEVHFCPCDGLDPKTKISIDWLLYRDGQLVNENLDQYAEISIYTLYPELTVGGGCQSIQWLGGQVPNNFGFCNHTASPNLIDSINGMTNCPQDWRTNYPGAMSAQYGIAPTSVVTNPITGTTTGAPGLATLYSEAFDYFYADFFSQTRTVVAIKWKQYCHNCSLVMRVRERTGGTDYNNAYWKKNADGTLSQVDYIGGHQSCCGQVLAMDSIHYLVTGDFSKEVCENDPYKFGVINDRCQNVIDSFLFTTAVEDTLVVFATLDSANCCHFKVDSVYNFHFFQRNTPEVVVLNADTTLCKCVPFTQADLRAMVDFDTVDMSLTYEHKLLWWKPNDDSWWNPYQVGPATYDLITLPGTWSTTMPTVPVTNLVGTFIYYVRQENGYANFNKLGSDIKDTIHCTGGYVALTVTVEEIEKPILPDNAEFCMETIDSSAVHQVIAKHDPKCATTTRWYTKISSVTDRPTNLVFTGDTFDIQLINYAPTTNKDGEVKFYALSYDGNSCYSDEYATYTIKFHQTPELKADPMSKTVFCPGATVDMTTRIKNSPDQTDRPYLFVWDGVTTIDYAHVVPAPAGMTKVVEVSGSAKANNAYLPIYADNNRNYSQQIFTPSEVPAGNITKMAFNYASNTALTNKSSNVEIYLTTTDKNAFASKADFVMTNLVLVYSGSLNATKGWNEINFTQSYNYTGEKNLVLVVKDNSGTYQTYSYFTCSKTSDYKAMLIRTDGNLPANPTTYTGSVYRYQYRSDVKFTVEPVGTFTNDNFQTASRELTLNCDTAYTTSVYVIDANGCKSEPVTFSYRAKDSIAPKVVPAGVSYTINACKVTDNNTPVYTKLNDLVAAFKLNVSDDCGRLDTVVTSTSTYDTAACEHRLTRIYTIKDACNNATTFTQVVVAHDSVKPQFVTEDGSFPYVRLYPVEGGNCTFNSPDSMKFVNAVAPFVYDNCTDSAYLMSTLKFNWENIDESPIGATNIFREKNHLTVEATITDRCDNSTTSLVIYIDRPEKLHIERGGITSTGDQCFGDTATLTFDPTYIVDDSVMGPFVPYNYTWFEVNGKNVTFSGVNALETEITFPEAGEYTFAMIVTDRNGCSDTSEYVTLDVRALPVMTINHIVLNGQTEPYCPTYGNLTIRAEIVNPVSGQTVAPDAYRWSGESVNVLSDSARTWVTIVPEWCDTLYYPTVTVTDDRGCVGTVTDTIEVRSNGPQFIGTIADTTVVKQDGCVFRIPDFKDLIDASLVEDDCYTFSQLKYSDAYGTVERSDWYAQEPVANTLLKTDSKVVTITIKNPCGKTTTLNVNVLKPNDVLTVSIDPTTAADCQTEIANNGVDYTATVSNAVGNVSYTWSLVGGTSALTNNDQAVYHAQGAMEPGTYTYKVDVEDGLHCTASNTATLTVYFQGADPYTRTWPNTLCDRYNGALAIDTAPRGYAYTLEHRVYGNPQTKISDVPAHLPTDWTTIVFDSLRPGYYDLTVYTVDGCERTHEVFIDEASAAPAAPTFTKVNVTVCTNNNGTLNINALAGFTYELYRYDGNVKGELVGTTTSYNNLSVGRYLIHATQNSTHCVSEAVVDIMDDSQRPVPTYSVPVANKNCENAGGIYTGQIKITSSLSYQYTVYAVNGSDTTWYLNNELLTTNNNPIKNLKNGKYYVTAYDPATGCATTSATTMTVGTDINTPAIDTSTTSNHYCTTTLADGTVSITNANRFLSYELDKKNGLFSYDSIGDQTSATLVSNKATWDSLPDKTYRISAIADNYCTASPVQVTVGSKTINPTIQATSTMNLYCKKDQGTLTLKNTNASTMNSSSYGYAHIASYKIQKGTFVVDTATTATTFTFNNLASGTYTWTATTNFGCKNTGTKEIEQYHLPAMQLDSTPNHMCAPTFEKPGDGTVTVVKPTVDNTPGNHFFEYYFYDAADVDMEVPYELPLTNTKYWLAAKTYHVVAYDTISGCSVDGFIKVENDFYEVIVDRVNVNPTTYCSKTDGDGSITIIAHSTNPDAELVYSLDNVVWQESNVFTGLANKKYGYYVKDLLSSCFVHDSIGVDYSDCRPDIAIFDNNNQVAPFAYCIDSEGIMICAEASYPAGSDCEGTFSYHWYGPCSNPNSSDESCIAVNVDHPMPNGCQYTVTVKNNLTGCTYDSTVYVHVYATPTLGFRVNNSQDIYVNPENSIPFCENEPIHIQVVCTNGQTLVNDKTVWTLGYDGTGLNIDIMGTSYTDDNITLCVYSESDKGCVSPIASLPLTFKRIQYVTKNIVTCDGSEDCKIKNPNGTVDTIISKPVGVDYPYTTTVTRTYKSVLTDCDSVVTFNFTLNGDPEFTQTPTVAQFCEDDNKTLADFENGYTVDWNGDEGNVKWYAAEGSGAYTKINAVSQITNGNYVITNAAGTKAMSSVAGNTTPNTNTYLTDPAANVTNPSDEIIWMITKNSDNSYSIYSPSLHKYLAGPSNNDNNIRLVDDNTENVAKWGISMNGSNFVFYNKYWTSRYLKYNTNSPRFATYSYSTPNTAWLALYKASALNYQEVPSDTLLTYEFVNANTIKRVATSDCGSDEEILDLKGKVNKKPAVVALPTFNPYCDGQSYQFTATVTSYGTQGGAKLFANGEQIGTEKTFTGANQVVNFGYKTVNAELDGKNLTLKVYNKNGQCDTVTVDSIMHVFSTTFPEITNNASPYCVGDQITLNDFSNVPSGYSNKTVWVKSTPNDYQLLPLPYTLTNRGLNNAQLYVKADASPCFTGLVSNTVTIKVNDKPEVPSINNMYVCANAFTLTEPTITWNGSRDNEADSGWLLRGTNGWAKATVAQIKTAATCPNNAEVAYFAKGSCGSDTSFFSVQLALSPSVSLAIGDQCPNKLVGNAFTTNTYSYQCSPVAYNSNSWSIVKANGTGAFTPNFETLTFAYLVENGYDGGKITHSVTNTCGTTTAYVTIDVLTNTYTAPVYQPSCLGDTLGAFVATAPTWTGSATVNSRGWQVKAPNDLNWTDATLATPINQVGYQVRYTWKTACDQTISSPETTLVVNRKPEITLNNVAAVCAGQTINPSAAINTVTYHGNQDKYDTIFTVGGVVVTTSTIMTNDYNGKYLVVTLTDNGLACGTVMDSTMITVNPLPNPSITGPARACVGENLQYVAGANFTNYVFHVNGQDYYRNNSNELDITAAMSGFGVAYDTVTVTVTDNNNCVGTSSTNVITKVTNAPEFIFRTMGGTETHNFTSTVGQGLQYTWEISTQCYGPDTLVYVEYDIYHNDTLIANNVIGEYLATSYYNNDPMSTEVYPYVTSNTFSWCATDGTPHENTSYYNYAVSNPSIATSGNHFPNTNLGLGTGHRIFDDFWLTFIEDRQVTKEIVPFRKGGTYKIVYRLKATSQYSELQDFYSPTCASITELYPMGGHNSLNNQATRTLLVVDSITIQVSGDDVVSNDPAVTPELAPAIVVDETSVAPEMEVWPNPAPAITTTFRGRVHHMSGEATVTITSLAGRQIYNGEMVIDNDSYYFEASVNNLSVGTYIMTVRTADAIVTKKVIVTR
jgi:hypothetical protein